MIINNKDIRLPKLFKKKWLIALRSGNYKQGTCNLVYNNKYCCLGVAGIVCGLSNEEMKGKGLFILTNNPDLGLGFTEEQIKKVPVLLRGRGSMNSIVNDLCHKNDSGTYNFSKIADYIEKNL